MLYKDCVEFSRRQRHCKWHVAYKIKTCDDQLGANLQTYHKSNCRQVLQCGGGQWHLQLAPMRSTQRSEVLPASLCSTTTGCFVAVAFHLKIPPATDSGLFDNPTLVLAYPARTL